MATANSRGHFGDFAILEESVVLERRRKLNEPSRSALPRVIDVRKHEEILTLVLILRCLGAQRQLVVEDAEVVLVPVLG